MIVQFFKKMQDSIVHFFTPKCNFCKQRRRDLVFWEETGEVICEDCTQKKLSEKRTSLPSH